MIPIYTVCQNHSHGIYIGFAPIIDNTKTRIVRQKGETVDYRFLSYEDFKHFIKIDEFVYVIRNRLSEYERELDKVFISITKDIE